MTCNIFLNNGAKTVSRLYKHFVVIASRNMSDIHSLSVFPKDHTLQNYIPMNGLSKSYFAKPSEDLSIITPYFSKTFNLAAYVNKSDFLQNLLLLNVNLSKIEKKPYVVEKILKLNLEDIKPHILFLNNYLENDDIGNFITRNPLILCESIKDLEVRVNYLQSKHFSKSQINRIISKNPFWLMFSTLRIDRRLGYFQGKFELQGDEIRFLSARQPQLITYNLHHVNTNTFTIKEEMGFNDSEMKQMLLNKPNLWMLSQRSLLQRFNYLHNTMKIPHSAILRNPDVLLFRSFKVKQRHLFLQKLGRDQFDPTKENYVPISGLIQGTDMEFCKTYAKCDISEFNIYLKTL